MRKRRIGSIDEAKAACQHAAEVAAASAERADQMAALQHQTMFGGIAPDQRSIDHYRSQVLSAVQQFAAAPCALTWPGCTPGAELFEDQQVIGEHDEFFTEAIAGSRSGAIR